MAPKKGHKAIVPVQIVPEKRGYEFGGPLGAFVLVFGLPVLIYCFAFLCNDVSGCPAPSLLHPSTLTWDNLEYEIGWPEKGLVGLYDTEVTLWVLSYYLVLLLLQIFLPGQEVEGVPLACGGRHKYKFNTFRSSILILAALGAGTYVNGADFVVWTFLWDNFVQVITANLIITAILSIWVYARSFSIPAPGEPNPELRELAPGGHTGNIIYDFFIGRELNSRITLPIPFVSEAARTIDIGVFCEMRPGLLGWIILNLSHVAHQYRTHGYVTDSILFITVAQAFYVLDSYYMEPAILTTMDIIMDGFGFMLCFGDLVWVPFLYSTQTRYLAMFPAKMGLNGIAVSLAVTGLGYYIFRGANNEKNRFRTNPDDPLVKHLKYITTKSGSKLLTSGWWGTARHINYLGDWLMSWGYCLPTGFAGYTMIEAINTSTGELEKQAVQTPGSRGWGAIFTYFYILYFGILLIHREQRDEEKCHKKYGKDWDKYTSLVRSKIIPGIY
ncbi:Delta(14)-sterol reductase [Talaromyces atroroseus]|uniref:Delta(14)-sterol reductase n=1 Tax=Talaromyces atroroseus TaxID=1441469 RepID=A0A1Q5Q929_TALAT|nr:Delta(14)-sterol reductase [Talaromyces atroroseus]OKL60638.1 Delta(14)-sterol reductase [Talaromyces atroroseus]